MFYIRYIMNLLEFGQTLRERRKLLRLTQQEVATANGMSRATISNLENGKALELGLRKAMALCATLGLEIQVKEVARRPTLRDLLAEEK